MNNKLLILVFLCIAAYPVHLTFAAPPTNTDYANVAYTVHNFANDPAGTFGLDNTERNYMSRLETADVKEICVFCHTPHNAKPAAPLWNKALIDVPAYRLYTSSATLSTVAKGAQLTPDSVSLLCLSCHDGKQAMNVLHNIRSSGGNAQPEGTYLNVGFGTDPGLTSFNTISEGVPGAYLSNIGAVRDSSGNISTASDGTNLTDDHPVGFSYTAAQAEKGNAALHDLPTAKGNGLRFFGPNRDRVECSSCHNPHVYYGYGLNGGQREALADRLGPPSADQLARTPFLVIGNTGSALCLGCHNK